MKRALLLLLWLGAFSALGVDRTWFALTPAFRYADLDTACSGDDFPPTYYLGLEGKDGAIQSAVLQVGSTQEIWTPRVDFEASELSGVHASFEPGGKLKLLSLTLSQRLLYWSFRHARSPGWHCPLPTLVTISSSFAVFSFEQGETSQTIRFSGKTKQGNTYNAWLGFQLRATQ